MDVALPLWLKISYTALVAVILPVYARCYGWRNFLWFSDIALVTTAVALWLENALLASMMAVGVLLPELLWNLSYFVRLLSGSRVSALADYMFDPVKPRYLRGLSLFHIALPVVLLWLLYRLGYDERALAAQTLLAWSVLPVTYAVVRPTDENVNWVYGFGERQKRLPPLAYLALLMIGFPLAVFLPTHLALKALFGHG